MLVHFPGPWNPLFGRLALKEIPYKNPILIGTFFMVASVTMVIIGTVTRMRLWGYLWRKWLTTVDHKNSVSCIVFWGS
jgi:cytochrome o ubiquinol oxidase subunit 1